MHENYYNKANRPRKDGPILVVITGAEIFRLSKNRLVCILSDGWITIRNNNHTNLRDVL